MGCSNLSGKPSHNSVLLAKVKTDKNCMLQNFVYKLKIYGQFCSVFGIRKRDSYQAFNIENTAN